MAFIPVDKIKSLREAAKNGDVRAKQILTMQMNGEDFSSSLEEYFKTPNATETKKVEPVQTEKTVEVIKDESVSDPKLKKFLEYNGVKPGDPDYESTKEAYYQEFPKARPGYQEEQMKATNTDTSDVNLPSYEDDGNSIYDEDDEPIVDDNISINQGTHANVVEEKHVLDKLMEEEADAITSYSNAILEIMKDEKYSEAEKNGIIARLEEIRKDETEHFEELKRLKEGLVKKEENNLVENGSIE